MERTFKQDVGTRFKKGETWNLPASSWSQIASNAGKSLSRIAVPTAATLAEAAEAPRPKTKARTSSKRNER